MKEIEYSKADADFIAKKLKIGKIFIVPTDTCFGIITKISKKNVDRIYQIKKRPKTMLIPIFIRKPWLADFIRIDNKDKRLADKFWPGALTIVAFAKKGKHNILSPVLSHEKTVAVREPADPLIIKILNILGEPVTATSANISGSKSCYSRNEIFSQFADRKIKPDYFISTEQLPKRESSTIIDITTNNILRKGEISKHAIVTER